jgi:hypothetical protein
LTPVIGADVVKQKEAENLTDVTSLVRIEL